MDFYKKIVKTRETSVLSEKEYKCVSLQAITNEAIKENNKRRLKELVEEINGHLADLRAIREEKDLKNKEKCEKLIKQFEECLVKIVNTRLFDILASINGQLQELQNQTNIAIRENNLEELRKLAERMERNIEVVKEIPEVKSARNAENGDENILEVVNKYTSLLNKVLAHINVQQRVISGPILLEAKQTNVEGNLEEQEIQPPKSNKIGLNEVEEKLKLMRQKRLNRLSTFVDQQTSLAEQRNREKSHKNFAISNKSFENLSQVPEKVENETTIIKSVHPPEVPQPSLYRALAQEKHVRAREQKVVAKNDKRESREVQEKSQTGFISTLRNSFGKGGISIGSSEKKIVGSDSSQVNLQEKNVPQPTLKERKEVPNDGNKLLANNLGQIQTEHNTEFLIKMTTESNLVKGGVTKSFAERQIENARSQIETPKVQLKSSNSTKTTPPRTPTQIRKIFNSFNSCVLGANNNKSIEDLPNEFKSPFEQQLKNVQLKNTGLTNRFKEMETPAPRNELETPGTKKIKLKNISTGPEGINKFQESSKEQESSLVLPPRGKRMPLEKPKIFIRKAIIPRQEKGENDDKPTTEEKVNRLPLVGGIEKSASQSHISILTKNIEEPNIGKEKENKQLWRSSLDNDSVMVRHNDADYDNPEPNDVTITIKRDSSFLEPPPERYSFSTFRSSSDSFKDFNAVENPIYGVVGPNDANHEPVTTKLNRQNSISVDAMLLSAKTKELNDFDFSTLDFVIEENKRRIRKMSYRRELSNESNRFIALEPVITKLEYAIKSFRGLKRDEDYSWMDKLLSKYYVKVDEVPANKTFDKIEKNNLLERLRKASKNLESRATQNEAILQLIFEEQVKIIGDKYGIA